MLAMRFGNGVGGLLACGAEFRFEFGDPGLELQHSLYAGEVHALVGEFLDAAEQGDVGVAVPTASAAELAGMHPQTLRIYERKV